MPDPQNAADTSASTQAPPPINLQGLRIRPADPAPQESTWQTIKRNATPQLDASNAAKGPTHTWDSEPSPQSEGETLYKENFGSTPEQWYGHAKKFIGHLEDKVSDKVLAPFREGLDRMGGDLEQAGETGHTKSGVPLTGPARALVGGTGALLKQVPVGRTVRETAQMAVTPPELGLEGKALSQELKAGEKTAANLEGIRYREVEPAPGKFVAKQSAPKATTKKELPPQPRLPDIGAHAAIKTDEGSIYFDNAPEKQRTHIMLAQDLGIPPERVVSGGWLSDGHYEASARSDAGKWGEQARAKAAVAEKRAGRAADSQSEPSIFTPEGAKPLADKLGAKVVGSVATGKTSADPYGINRGPKDLDLRVDGEYDSKKVADAMQEQGFQPSGSSVVSPEEAKKSGKDYGGPGWKRIEHFENAAGHKVDIFHDTKNSPFHQKLFDEATAALGPETKRTSAKTTLNASGESSASQEAINRAASEKSQGVKRFRVDTRSGKTTPLIGSDAVDAKAGKYEKIVMRGPKGETVLDSGAGARP